MTATKTEQIAITAYLAQIGAKGGKAAAINMTKEEREARAKKAVAAREAKRTAARAKNRQESKE